MKIMKGWHFMPLILLSFIIFFKAEIALSQKIDFENYDPNTEVVLEGEIQKIVIPDRGMVSVIISRKGKLYQAFLCPRWFYFELKPNLNVGDRVRIKGAKIYSQRHGLVFAVKVLKNLSTKEEIILRDKNCMPCWRGRGRWNLQ